MTIIRPASAADTPFLPDIERSSGELFRQFPGLEWVADDAVQSQDRHRELIADGVAYVVERSDGGIAAFLNGELMPDALHIWQVAVRRDQQGRGTGRRLIEAAEALAARRGIGALTLTTFRTVPWNEPYYLRLGFLTLDGEALGPRLEGVLEAEERAGLSRAQRCAMRKPLQ